MFEQAVAQAAARAETVAGQAIERVAATVRAFPDVEVTIEDRSVVVRGRGLLKRWLGDGTLRFGLRGWR